MIHPLSDVQSKDIGEDAKKRIYVMRILVCDFGLNPLKEIRK